MAASITQHDATQARLAHTLHFGSLSAVEAAAQLQQLSNASAAASQAAAVTAPALSAAGDAAKRERFEQQVRMQNAQIKKATKMLSKRMASDTDLWRRIHQHQEM